MAVVNTLSNNFKIRLMNKEVDMNSDVFKISLMNTAFAFNPATHALWADVSASEIAAGNGYSAGGQTLQSGELVQDNSANKGVMTWHNAEWLAAGGDIADTGAAIIRDTSVSGELIVGCSDFGVNYSTLNGMPLKFVSIAVSL
jgi:hypothetical protein